MVRSVLVICSGNICRSPIAERFLRRDCIGLAVDSAGTLEVPAHLADPLAASLCSGSGITLAGHSPRKLTVEMARQYDLLLAMEPHHISEIVALAPWARGKTLLFGHWSRRRAIPDPWRRGPAFFEHVFGLLEQDAREWALRLNSHE
ncbi:protein tyrosine phosphatase [Enterobacter sp. Ap-916]|uniref:arsenate reductase/protein-tyrosine-phosphatase family protein n=1 Tax=unclassified Enterobacter TaxID=2608935 RepID=UPI001421319A|nr:MULTISPECIES: protein tyrosine phosphatase [unclassified Enterobacter]NIF58004.1 protein tyrosine phosphatase [Enterobacter sp. Ap-867]NIG28054.1 protein tyrosine phosphatase [Enterobacter sp. Ap-916]